MSSVSGRDLPDWVREVSALAHYNPHLLLYTTICGMSINVSTFLVVWFDRYEKIELIYKISMASPKEKKRYFRSTAQR